MNEMRILFSTIYLNSNSHMDEINRKFLKALQCYNLVRVLETQVYYSIQIS